VSSCFAKVVDSALLEDKMTDPMWFMELVTAHTTPSPKEVDLYEDKRPNHSLLSSRSK
jgi:hypothetical protein